ncbi:autotransporter assembly complex protein TamA [Moraxella oblonga]|uniref:autotransporter assembly complex protein TamA n=1 Tax=Moraxella oblonga TaxID=200413 RepID=UPI00082F67BA|nr:BamA/TamA family outer membrane protein [Moraxella oblonga]
MNFTKKNLQKTFLCQTIIMTTLGAFAQTQNTKPQTLFQGNNDNAIQQDDISLNPFAIEQKLLGRTMATDMAFDNQNPISRLDNPATPIGLDVTSITKLPTLESIVQETTDQTDDINPDDYIPVYEYEETLEHNEPNPTSNDDDLPKPNALKRVYNRLFKDGVETVPHIEVVFYQGKKGDNAPQQIDKKLIKTEPFANIKATLTDMTAQSMSDFTGAVPRLRQAIISASRAVGYYEVDFSIVKAGANKLHVIIHNMGDGVKVEHKTLDVRGEGATHKAYTAITNDPQTLNVGDTFHHGQYEALKTRLTDASGEHGFFDSKWLNNSVEVLLPDNIADVSLVYDTGTQYTFDEVVFFTIDPDTGELTTDPDKLPIRPKILKQLMTFNMGDDYNRSAVRNLSNSLLATGFFNAVNTETVLPESTQKNNPSSTQNTSKNETVVLDDGVVVDVSPIEFTTSQAINDKLALIKQKAEQLYMAPDDRLLVTDTHQKSKSLLGRISDAVSNVAKIILPDESDDALPKLQDDEKPPILQGRKTAEQVYADKKVPLYIFVMSDKPKDAQIGIGWGSDSGTRLIGKFEHHLLNRHGMQAGADVRFSEQKKGVQAYITRPHKHPLNDTLKASLNYEEEDLNRGKGSFDLSSRTLEAILSRNRINETGWNRTYSLRYRLDELETNMPRQLWQDLPVRFIDGKPTQEALLLGYTMNKMVADNIANPMRGYRQHYSLEAGTQGLVTDTSLAILQARLSGIYSFGDNAYGKNRQHQLIGSLHGGYLWAKDFESVPYKLRFFAGGDQSIRGYNYQSLAPLSDKGYLVGGQALAVASGEYNYEIMENLRLGVFADVGGAYDKHFKNDTKIGAGLGVRYASPVGQVRLDVATGVGEEGNPIKLHFFIGIPF